MQTTKEKAYKKIVRLVEQFDEHIDEYKRGKYNEHQTRVDYINPFFNALGWDMDNKQGLAEAYREVIHEDKIKIGGSTKAPDYCFTVYGQRKFFVDAKKPSVNIKGDIAPAYQVRRYGWSARLPVAIVTDFEEFSIYDCNKKPNQTDKASVSRIKYITYDNYLDEFDFFWDTFAKENILKGRFDKYVQSDAKKRGTANVDDEFLKSIEEWRTYLATTIALRNKSLIEDEINYAVQKNIDRIIFLRICEDRGIEHYGDLKNSIKKGVFYENLFKLYRIADEKYNSGLFDFNEDTITPLLTVDNKVVKNIISDLYYPVSPYEFSVLPADILGSVYERFLGKTIRLTKAHHAKIEEKPEVRKAGGVYYTPKYIVDYIVENTVGKLIRQLTDKKPKDIEKIKIVDPACGSGSFLIGAYQYLLNWHLQYYLKNPPQKNPVRQSRKRGGGKDNPLTPDGNLTTAEKKRILLNNIYGVDIDAQAVEVTKLNLLLKALEGETNVSISKQLTFFNERVLPNLGDNIKCGNSLIGTDFYDNQLVLFPEQIKKINAFDWDKAFPEIFKNGGFDVVIGNPPWVFTRDVEFGKSVKNYYSSHYLTNIDKSVKSRSNQTGKVNLYGLFIIKGLEILNSKGLFSFIIPNTILRTTVYESVRKYLIDNTSIERIIDLKSGVFEGVTASTIILILGLNKNKNEIEIIDNPAKLQEIITKKTTILKDLFYDNPSYLFNIFVNKDENDLFKKMQNKSIELEKLVNIFNGIATYKGKKGISNIKLNNTYKKLLSGKNIGRYFHNWTGQYIEYVPEKLQRARDEKIFLESEKLIMQRIGGILVTSYDDEQYYTYNSVNNLILKKTGYSFKYILAILNSKLMQFYYIKNFTNDSSLTVNISKTFLDKLPIQKIDFLNPKEKQTHDTIVNLVDNLLNLNKELQTTKLDTQRQQLQRAIDHAENKIDELVYELYGLTEEEIGIVENLG